MPLSNDTEAESLRYIIMLSIYLSIYLLSSSLSINRSIYLGMPMGIEDPVT